MVIKALRFAIVSLFIIVSFSSRAQIQQPERFEITLGLFERSFEILTLKEHGVVLYRQTNQREKDGRIWEFIYLDADLRELWRREFVFSYDLNLVGFASNTSHFYLLFSDSKTNFRNFSLFEFDLNGSLPTSYTITNLFPMYLTHFEVTDYAAILGGYLNYKPVVIHFGFTRQRSIVLPTIYNKNTEIIQLKVNPDNTLTVLVTERNEDRQITISVKHFDKDGDILVDRTLKPEEGTHFIFGRAAGDQTDALLVAGTYSTTKTFFSRGIFISRIGEDGIENSNYYNYGDLKNFFNYMKVGREKRVRERIARKRIKGKKLRFNYRLMVHEIIDTPDGFLMLGEAFYPKYNNEDRLFYEGPWDPMSTRSLGMYLAGYKYTHAVVIGFDDRGRLKWDNSFEISDVLSPSLDQFVHAAVEGDSIILLYLFDNIIRTKIIRGNEVLEGQSVEDLRLKYPNDEVKSSSLDFGGLQKWKDGIFVAFGVQRIKNMKDSGVDLNRRVFFVNKLIFN